MSGGGPLTDSDFAVNRENRGEVSGEVGTTMLGADYMKGRMMAGLSLSHSRALGEYTGVAWPAVRCSPR